MSRTTSALAALSAGEKATVLEGRDIDELNGHAGYRPGRGYVHPIEAADEILDGALDPFLRDLEHPGCASAGGCATVDGVTRSARCCTARSTPIRRWIGYSG